MQAYVSLPRAVEAPASPSYVCHSVDALPDLLDLHRLHPQRYPHLLESVAHGTAQARYDILFAFPEYTLTLDASGHIMREGKADAPTNYLQALDDEWQHARLPSLAPTALPFTGGWFVYLGYELVTQIEPRLAGVAQDRELPVANLTRIPAAVIRDHHAQQTHLVCESGRHDVVLAEMKKDLMWVARAAHEDVQLAALVEDNPEIFLEGVKRTLAYIRAGDVFQVNLSRGWRAVLARPLAPAALYDRLRRANPAPFAGLMTFGRQQAIISSSPERLVEVKDGRVVTRPIAGTYPRSEDRKQDERWSRDLLRHPKERAEHIMLIDLERNDLGRVCRTGTVAVEELMVLESYQHVHHIVSGVSGKLRDGVTPGQVIGAVFPGGTITGCPKVRCMEIISELEGTARGGYTGSMGYINRDGSMDLNILIRTIVQAGEQISLRAGAGIVADSRPRRELQETRAKAKGMLRALGRG
ncbi:MAG: aminodeoxychorismate synthase component I [Acidiferrobacterales bacterium]